MSDYHILLELAILFFAAKLCGLLAERLHVVQVAGEIVAGLLIGPSLLNLVQPSDFLTTMSELGVILLMYTAGLETDLKKLIHTGPKALLIACCGVFFPLACGVGLFEVFNGFPPAGSDDFYQGLFLGVVLTATSVSITVAALQELGQLTGTAGTAIMGAAIIDDVIGMLVLTFACGLKAPGTNITIVVVRTLLFFLFAVGAGVAVHFLFQKLSAKYPHHRRLTIFGMALCFAMSYCAEEFFGVADITGAYAAGIMLCTLDQAGYIAKRTETENYTMFSPLFFASIGIKTDFSGMTASLLLFAAAFVAVGMVSKLVGCGIVSRVLGFSNKDSLRIGLGMMTRGEVALITAQKAITLGALSVEYFAAVILLVICSSILTPVFLKLAYNGEPAQTQGA